MYDADGRLVLYRAWSPKGPVWTSINETLMRVADMLRNIKPTFTNGTRGDFAAYFFSLHRGSQSVRTVSYSFTVRVSNLFASHRIQSCPPITESISS